MGSIEKRSPNTWRLVVSCGLDTEGKQVKKTKTVKANDKDMAKDLLIEFENEIEGGLVHDAHRLSFEKFVKLHWLPKYAEKELAPKTLYRYKELLDKRIYDGIGHLKLSKIRPTHIMDFIGNLQEDGIRLDKTPDGKLKPGKLSDRTVLHHFRLISAILSTAVEWQFIPSNPAKRVKAPKVIKPQPRFYNETQSAAMLAALQDEPIKYRAIVHLAIDTGLREGELFGLAWPDVNLDEASLVVHKASQYLPGKGTFLKDPKTETSKRIIALPKYIVHILSEYKEWQNGERNRLDEKWQESGRVFTAWNGRPMYPLFMSKWFPQFLDRHELPRIPFHGLRHTAATMDLADGAPIVNVKNKLGHTDISTTQIYVHALQSVDRELAEKRDERYANSQKEEQE